MAAPLRARLQSAIADASDDVRSFLEGPRGRRWALRSGRGRLGGLALAVLALVVYLPGALSMPPVDRDESRFAQASRQMFESVALPEDQRDEKRHSGGVVVPRVQDRDRLNKPPLIYWVQAMSAAVLTGGEPLDDAIWMYRVPSVLCAVLAVLFTWRLGLVLFDPRAAWLGAALLAVCPIMVWEAGQARADSLLLACTTGALWAMARVLTSKQGGALAALLFWVALALASLAKFPVPLMVAGLALIAWIIATREVGSLARLRPVTGLIVFAAMTLPWVFAVGDRIGWDVMLESLSNETLGRSAEAKEGHAGPPGYHTVLLPGLFWPGSLLTALAVGRAFGVGWRTRARIGDDAPPGLTKRVGSLVVRTLRGRPGRRGELFCLCVVLPSWIAFELVATKLPHYTMPLYPPLALLSARAVFAAGAGSLRGLDSLGSTLGLRLWAVLGIAGAVVLAGAAFVASAVTRRFDVIAIMVGAPILLLSLLLMLRAARLVSLGRVLAGQFVSLTVAALGFATLTGLALPNFGYIWISPAAAEAFAEADPEGLRPMASVEYHEDSLVFLTRGRVERLDEDDLELWRRRHPLGLYLVPSDGAPVLPGDDEADRPRARVTGFNYSSGDPVDLELHGGRR